MDPNDTRAVTSKSHSQYLDGQRSGLPAQVDPEEIYRVIDRVKSEIRQPSPGLIARLVDPNARTVADAIAKANLEDIQSKTALITGMRRVIDVYIETHIEDIRTRQKAYLLPKLSDLLDQVSSRLEESNIEMARLAQKSVDQLRRIPNLPPEILARQIQSAYHRAEDKQESLYRQQLIILDSVGDYMRQIIGS